MTTLVPMPSKRPRRDYQAIVAELRTLRSDEYLPALDAYVAAVAEGRTSDLAGLAEALSDAADELENAWTRMLYKEPSHADIGEMNNEAAGAMAFASELWHRLSEAHKTAQGRD